LVLLLALGLWRLYGSGLAGYDSIYALVWGRELAHGHLPDYQATPAAPTPHPLAELVGVLLSLLHGDAPALGVLSLALLGWAAFRFGASLLSPTVGAALAVVLLTRPAVVQGALYGATDAAFVALVLWAGMLENRRPRRGYAVLGALALAGLLRPEAWLLSAGYLAYVLRDAPAAARPRLIALACSAPALWIGLDLAATGDALWSLHGTRALTERFARPHGPASALRLGAGHVEDVLGPAVAWLGLGGCLLLTWAFPRRALLPGAVLVAGMAGFVALGFAELPLLGRYLYLPATVIALGCAVALLGWRELPHDDRLRRPWLLAACSAAAAVLATAPGDRRALARTTAQVEAAANAERDLKTVAGSRAVRRSAARCRPVAVPDYHQQPVLAYVLGIPAGAVHTGPTPAAGTVLIWTASGSPGAGWRLTRRQGAWSAYARC
jgi:hypothetical protein